MIEVCPRCHCRLGSPLKSGRLVCANCAWSSDPAPAKKTSRPQRSPFIEIVILCWRIVQRSFSYVGQMIQDRVQDFRAAKSGPKGKRLVDGLSDRLSALEQAIPTSDSDGSRWMSLEDAFRYLGGNPNDPESAVTTVSGASSLLFRRFRVLKTAGEFRAFGLEANLARRDANKPWLRWTKDD